MVAGGGLAGDDPLAELEFGPALLPALAASPGGGAGGAPWLNVCNSTLGTGAYAPLLGLAARKAACPALAIATEAKHMMTPRPGMLSTGGGEGTVVDEGGASDAEAAIV